MWNRTSYIESTRTYKATPSYPKGDREGDKETKRQREDKREIETDRKLSRE